MDGDRDRFGGVRGMGLAAAAIGLCCAAPLLIVAGGAIVAAVGWSYLGVGAGLAVLTGAVAVAVYRYRRGMACKSPVPSPHLDSVRKEF